MAGSGEVTEEGLQEDNRKLPGVVGMFMTLIVLVDSWVCAYVRTYQLYSLNMSSSLYFNYILTKLLKTKATVYKYSPSLYIKKLLGSNNLKALAIGIPPESIKKINYQVKRGPRGESQQWRRRREPALEEESIINDGMSQSLVMSQIS